MFKNKNLQILSYNWPHDMDISDVKIEMCHSRRDSNTCHSETDGKKVKGNDRKLRVYNFSSPQKLNHCDSRPNHMEMPKKFGRQENERGQLPGKYGW
jgi:hypothetical protein